MTTITCTECEKGFALGTPGWITLTEAGRNRAFCSSTCCVAWLTERERVA